ncbi:hypothetical protein GCM10027612_76140 [Microbispora bryophytorum subsp. camponoti]
MTGAGELPGEGGDVHVLAAGVDTAEGGERAGVLRDHGDLHWGFLQERQWRIPGSGIRESRCAGPAMGTAAGRGVRERPTRTRSRRLPGAARGGRAARWGPVEAVPMREVGKAMLPVPGVLRSG